ncbi:MAG: endonuclease/exonuclease/phosphatase family protein [Bacteroidales bacterium]|nr:endonuclease/exonuclease/phosphatase family protein [Bacteroidales bacterium]
MNKGKGRKKGISISGILFRIIVVVSAAALILSYTAPYVNPTTFSIPMFFGLYFIPILFINLFLLLIGLLRWKRYVFISFIALLPSLFFADLLYRTGKEEIGKEGNSYKILTYNVGRFSAAKKGLPERLALQEIEKFVISDNPDIVCLQEFRTSDTTAVSQLFGGKYPYRSYHFFRGTNWFGNITLSKFPITASGELTNSKSTNLCIWSDISLKSKTIRIYNCHLESLAISFTSLVKKMSKNLEISTEVAGVHEKLRETAMKRSGQVDKLKEHLSSCDKPLIVCGDFNDTPISYTYRNLSNGLKDSFVEGGKGFSASYSILWPLLRIDYILLDKTMEADRNVIQRIPYSDHYPVSTYIYIK